MVGNCAYSIASKKICQQLQMKLLIACYYEFYYINLLEMLPFKLKTLIISMAQEEGGRKCVWSQEP